MKIIDKTPLQDENGQISIIARIQGTLTYGFNWYPELEAQKMVIAQLHRSLEKSFVLIRNFTLPNSEIVIPLILIGSGSISVIFVTQAKGHFEAKGDQWNTITSNGISVPAKRNLVDLVAKLTRAFQKYLDIKKINTPIPVEPVLIASDPGAQIESLRPIARVVRSDAIKQFAGSLLQARAVMRTDMIIDLADRIIDPRPHEETNIAPPQSGENPVSRAQAIFNASDPSKALDPNDLGPAFEQGDNAQDVPQNLREPNPARPLHRRATAAPAKKKFLGMTNTQITLLAVMLVIQCCIFMGLGILYLNL
ncbi:MAG: hypothetical protein QY332_19340 [Anaerolineales bacterium]|nr:MAG: hypothetical protein QY332_19340 [Anaerolineales bacterium]